MLTLWFNNFFLKNFIFPPKLFLYDFLNDHEKFFFFFCLNEIFFENPLVRFLFIIN